MKNINLWRPSKYVYDKGKLVASRDTNEVQASSRLMVDLIANFYDRYLAQYCRGNLIDLGCGKVPLYGSYKNLVDENICVDWKNTTHKNPYLDFECDLTKKLPLKNNHFDTIILSDVLEHIPNPENLFKEMRRILKKGGKIIMNVPFYYWLHETPHDYYRYTQYALKNFSEKNGFRVIILESIGGFPEVLADIVSKNLVRISFIGKLLALLIQKITKFLIKRTKSGVRLSADTKESFPFGYFMVVEKI